MDQIAVWIWSRYHVCVGEIAVRFELRDQLLTRRTVVESEIMLELHNESREWVERARERDVFDVWMAGSEVEHGRGIASLREGIEVRKRW